MLIGKYDNTEVFLKARFGHTFVIGATGSGKSTYLHNCAVKGHLGRTWCVCVIDPLGETADSLMNCVPPDRIKDCVVIDPTDLAYPVGINLVGRTPKDERHVVTERVLGALKRYYQESWGIQLERIIRQAIRLHLDMPGVSILSIYKMLVSKKHRNEIITLAKDPMNQFFWQDDFDKWTPTEQREAIRPVLNRLEQLLLNPAMRNMFGQVKTTVSLEECMNTGKIVFIRLPKGELGEEPVNLLGSLFIAEIQNAALARSKIPEQKRRACYIYIDESHNFLTNAFINMFSELRKYRVGLTLATQFTRDHDLTKAILGNVHNVIVFRVGPEDAELLCKRLPQIDSPYPHTSKQVPVSPADLVNLRNYRAFVDFTDVPGEIDLYDKDTAFETGLAATVIQQSRETYGTPRDKVEEAIGRFLRKGRSKKRKNV